ncbi:hypothetical protein SAMN05421736_101862 [Evansella caseinilytica]|uniref:Uncharacterized protein n=1 Tax=Evansella caseinilytica TaxID=1503961 RepID=A0A1H3ILQ2_9BACI|nr:hypothetical protein [Evansella caseinilytica]SDY28527.1 hypothetical protein SAMN05421736_101862 [Evansella caseinilytica]
MLKVGEGRRLWQTKSLACHGFPFFLKKMCVQKGGHHSGKKIEARQSRAAERTQHLREQRSDNGTMSFADRCIPDFLNIL